jgi:hypothetical protein
MCKSCKEFVLRSSTHTHRQTTHTLFMPPLSLRHSPPALFLLPPAKQEGIVGVILCMCVSYEQDTHPHTQHTHTHIDGRYSVTGGRWVLRGRTGTRSIFLAEFYRKGIYCGQENQAVLAQVRQGKGFLSNKIVKWQISSRV